CTSSARAPAGRRRLRSPSARRRRTSPSRRTVIAVGEGEVRLRRAEGLRSLRLPAGARADDVQVGGGVLGARETAAGSYVHLDGRDRLRVRFGEASGPRLVSANAAVASSTVASGQLRLRFEGVPPFEAVVREGKCRPGRGRSTHEGRRHRLRGAQLVCEGQTR
ncbi:MAG: hypothetical protein AAFZ18_10615, partial [Myxococcota bacterium]